MEEFIYVSFYVDDNPQDSKKGSVRGCLRLMSTDSNKELIWKTPIFPVNKLNLLEELCVGFITCVTLMQPLTTDDLLILSQLVFVDLIN